VIGIIVIAALAATGIVHVYALMSFGLCAFVLATISSEFFKGSRAIGARTGQNLLAAMVELTHRNTRRYGGYLVHIGVVIMFIGFTGKAFDKDRTVEVKVGDSFQIGSYDVKVRDIRSDENNNYAWSHAVLEIYKGGSHIKTMEPEKRLYKASRQPSSEVAIWRRLDEDLYINFAGLENNTAIFQAYVFPLVSWIWIGYWVLMLGTIICLVPSKRKPLSQLAPGASRPAPQEVPVSR
jgi:cytochrome c-type biogenesis protein CcmF